MSSDERGRRGLLGRPGERRGVRIQPASRGIPDDTFLQESPTPPLPSPAPRPARQTDSTTTLVLGPESAEPVGVLLAIDGPLAGTAAVIPFGRVTIGRSPACQIALADPYLSSESLLVISEGREITIQPLGARNPIRLNDGDVPPSGAYLLDGDLLQMGGSVFSFRTTRPQPPSEA